MRLDVLHVRPAGVGSRARPATCLEYVGVLARGLVESATSILSVVGLVGVPVTVGSRRAKL